MATGISLLPEILFGLFFAGKSVFNNLSFVFNIRRYQCFIVFFEVDNGFAYCFPVDNKVYHRKCVLFLCSHDNSHPLDRYYKGFEGQINCVMCTNIIGFILGDALTP